ncbi:MAG: LamG domain-containing protein [Verrucomicrobiota bacterium]
MEEITEGVVADVSGNGHDATAHGKDNNLPAVAPGIIDQGLRFTAADQQYLEVKKIEDLAAPAAFTVMAWIKPMSPHTAYEIIGNKWDSGEGEGWRFRHSWKRAAFQFGTTGKKEHILATPAWSVPQGFWSHVAATYDGKTLRLHVDCNLLAEKEIVEQIMPSPRPLIIGNYIGRKDAYAFDGMMDEVKVFGTVLSEEEIFAEATRGMR